MVMSPIFWYFLTYPYMADYATYIMIFFLFTPRMIAYVADSMIPLLNYAMVGSAAYIIISFCLISIWTALLLILKIVFLK